MKKKFKIIGKILLAIFIALAIGSLYLLFNRFSLPNSIKSKVTDFTKAYYGLDVGLDDFVVDLPSNEVAISSFSLSVTEKNPFLIVGSTTVRIASGTSFSNILENKAPVDKIVINQLKFDMTVPQLSEASGAFKLPSIPASEIELNGFVINTPYGEFDLSSNTAYLKKEGDVADIDLNIPNGPFGIQTFLKTSVNLETGNASISISINHKNLADCLPIGVMASERGVGIDDGAFSLYLNYNGNIVNEINEPLKNLDKLLNEDLYGYISIKNTNVVWKGLRFQGDMSAKRDSDSSWKINSDIDFAKGKININGDWLGHLGNMTDYAVDFKAENINLTKKELTGLGVPDYDFKPGTIGLRGRIYGDIASFTGHGMFSVKNCSFMGKNLDKAAVAWVLSRDLTVRSKGILNTYLGELNASSTIWFAGENKFKGVLEGALKEIELKEIGSLVQVPLNGKCSGPFTVEFDLINPLNAVYTFNASMDNGAFYTFNTKHIDAMVTGSGTDWKITDPHLLFENGGEILVDGVITNKDVDVEVKVKNANLSSFGVPDNIASGVINVEGDGHGSLEAPEAHMNLWTSSISLMGMPLNSIKSEIKLKDDVLGFIPMVISPIDGSMIDGYCFIDLKNSKINSGRINFQQFCLDMLRPFFPPSIASGEIDGVFSGYLDYNRNSGENVWKALVDGRDILLAGQDIDSVYLEADGINKQAELKHLFIRGMGGSIDLTGQFINNKKFAGSVNGESLNFDQIEILRKYIPSIQGELDFQGDIDWDDKHRKGNFTVFANHIKTDNRDLGNYGGEIVIDDEKLEIRNGEFDKLGIKLGGDLMWGARQPYNLKIDLNNVDFSFIPQAHDVDTFDNGCILVDGNCLIQGDLASFTPDFVNLKINNIRIQKDNDVIVTNKPVDIIYQNGSAELRSLELKYKLGLLSIEGVLSPDKDIAVLINGDNFSAKALGNLFGIKGIDFDGDVTLNTRVFGKINDIKYSSTTEINSLVVEGREINKVQAIIEGDSKKLNINETFIKLKNSSFDIKGNVELDNFIPQNLDVKLSIPESPIKDFNEYMPDVIKTADGKMKALISITGNPANPKITGDLHLDAKKIQLSKMKKPFTDIEFDITTNDMITSVNKLQANVGKGNISGFGNVDFKNADGKLDVHIKAEKLDLPLQNLDISNASATLDLTGDIYNPDIKGYVYIPRGKLSLNTNLIPQTTTSKPIFETLKYFFEVEIPRNFWVKNPFVNAELKGKCSISGDLDNFTIDGGISTIQGKIFFKQRQFKIQNGELRFGGVDNSFDPYVFVKSEGQVGSTKIFLTLTGNISNFKPQVYSTPPMSEGDIIALLTLGRDLNSAMNSDTKELFEDEVLEGLKNSYISSLIGESIGNALNLDELYLTSAFDKETGKSQSYVRIGKYVTDRIFMAYEGTMSNDRDESYIFEYRLPKGLVLSVEFEEPENNQVYGFRYDWQFW